MPEVADDLPWFHIAAPSFNLSLKKKRWLAIRPFGSGVLGHVPDCSYHFTGTLRLSRPIRLLAVVAYRDMWVCSKLKAED